MLTRRIKDAARILATPECPNSFPRIPKDNQTDSDMIEASLRQNYYSADQVYLSSDVGENDLQDHLFRRVDIFRNTVIPWLISARSLKGASVFRK